MDEVITVEPFAEGWSVRRPNAEWPEVFDSGAKAEEAAKRVAAGLAAAGRSSQVLVYLRDGVLAGRFVYRTYDGGLPPA
jgi:hypothetical protein